MRFIRPFLLSTALLLISLGLGSCASSRSASPSLGHEKVVPLSSLEPRCRLTTRWIGMFPILPEGLWLSCNDGDPILVVHPLNLFEHVKVDDAEKALEIVELFTAYDLVDRTSKYFIAFPFHEVRWDHVKEMADSGFDDAKKLWSLHREPLVEAHTEKKNCKPPPSGDELCSDVRKFFNIERILVNRTDGHVYSIVETIDEDGWYSIVEKGVVYRDYYNVDPTL